MSSATSFLKIVNVLFMLMGIGFIAAGGYVYSNFRIAQVPIAFPREVAIGSIVVGVFIFVTAGLGHWGASKKNKIFLTLYSIIVLGLLAAQLGIAAFATKRKAELQSILNTEGWNQLNDEYKNYVQETFKCCGFTSPLDSPGSQCPAAASTTGCYSKLIEYQETELQKFYIAFFVLLVVEIGCFAAALIICRKK